MAVDATARATLDIDLITQAGALDRVRQVARDLGFTIGGLPVELRGGQVQIQSLSKIQSGCHARQNKLRSSPPVSHASSAQKAAATSWQLYEQSPLAALERAAPDS